MPRDPSERSADKPVRAPNQPLSAPLPLEPVQLPAFRTCLSVGNPPTQNSPLNTMSHSARSEHESFRKVYDFRSHIQPERSFLVPPAVPFTVLTDLQAQLSKACKCLREAACRTETAELSERLAQAFPNEEAWQTADKADTESSSVEGKIGLLTTYQAEFITCAANLLEETVNLRRISSERNPDNYQLASKVCSSFFSSSLHNASAHRHPPLSEPKWGQGLLVYVFGMWITAFFVCVLTV